MNKYLLMGLTALGTIGIACGGVAIYNGIPSNNNKISISRGESLLVGQGNKADKTTIANLQNKVSDLSNQIDLLNAEKEKLSADLVANADTISALDNQIALLQQEKIEIEIAMSTLQTELENSVILSDRKMPAKSSYTKVIDLPNYKSLYATSSSQYLYYESNGRYYTMSGYYNSSIADFKCYYKLNADEYLLFCDSSRASLGILLYDSVNHTLTQLIDQSTGKYGCQTYLGEGKFFFSSYSSTYKGASYYDATTQTMIDDIIPDTNNYRFDYACVLDKEANKYLISSADESYVYTLGEAKAESHEYLTDGVYQGFVYDTCTILTGFHPAVMYTKETGEFTQLSAFNGCGYQYGTEMSKDGYVLIGHMVSNYGVRVVVVDTINKTAYNLEDVVDYSVYSTDFIGLISDNDNKFYVSTSSNGSMVANVVFDASTKEVISLNNTIYIQWHKFINDKYWIFGNNYNAQRLFNTETFESISLSTERDIRASHLIDDKYYLYCCEATKGLAILNLETKELKVVGDIQYFDKIVDNGDGTFDIMQTNGNFYLVYDHNLGLVSQYVMV